ncbi:glycosyltransferase family 2 protein [Paludibaculum fermentans]|uniref:glycosyltransferase family 2 protein n=1 Tax=Paludibaculum fermentans TaxID=1473598 RepID=UPI003EC0AF44
MSRAAIAALILTKNEEADLPGCLESLRGLADEVFVIDSGSTDRTVEIAESFGAVVLTHPFENQARQTNWAIENVTARAAWMIRIDADERVTPELRQSLVSSIQACGDGVNGFLIARRTFFLGKRLRFGGTFPVWLLRVWRRGAATCENRWMDEHMVVHSGAILKAQGELDHLIPKDIADWSRKHVSYAQRECLDVWTTAAETVNSGGQAALRRKAKNGLYYRLPPLWRALGYMSFRYFLQLGFLDGSIGFIYHFLQAGWYRVLVDSLLLEGQRRAQAREKQAGLPSPVRGGSK